MQQWALITGASTGIGYELAKLLAADHFNLVLVARNETRLNQVANELKAAHGTTTRILPKDLSDSATPQEIFEASRDTPISVLINNAGFGSMRPFAEEDLKCSVDMIRVNVESLVQLTHLFLRPMLERKAGRILNVASTAAFQPGPFTAIYYASKAFVFSFSVAVAEEVSGTGVTVTTLCPGFTKTEFHERAGMKRSSGIPMMSAEAVATAGYRGMLRGKRIVIPGTVNKITSCLAHCMPVNLTSRIVRKINGK